MAQKATEEPHDPTPGNGPREPEMAGSDRDHQGPRKEAAESGESIIWVGHNATSISGLLSFEHFFSPRLPSSLGARQHGARHAVDAL